MKNLIVSHMQALLENHLKNNIKNQNFVLEGKILYLKNKTTVLDILLYLQRNVLKIEQKQFIYHIVLQGFLKYSYYNEI